MTRYVGTRARHKSQEHEGQEEHHKHPRSKLIRTQNAPLASIATLRRRAPVSRAPDMVGDRGIRRTKEKRKTKMKTKKKKGTSKEAEELKTRQKSKIEAHAFARCAPPGRSGRSRRYQQQQQQQTECARFSDAVRQDTVRRLSTCNSKSDKK